MLSRTLVVSTLLAAAASTTAVTGFAIVAASNNIDHRSSNTQSTTRTTTSGSTSATATLTSSRSTTALHMGLFDGVKEAFSAPAASQIDSERETPIDRWMGWSVASENNSGVDINSAAGGASGAFTEYFLPFFCIA
jgi:hypothetical protein